MLQTSELDPSFALTSSEAPPDRPSYPNPNPNPNLSSSPSNSPHPHPHPNSYSNPNPNPNPNSDSDSNANPNPNPSPTTDPSQAPPYEIEEIGFDALLLAEGVTKPYA